MNVSHVYLWFACGFVWLCVALRGEIREIHSWVGVCIAGIATLGMGEEEKTEEHKIEHVIKTYAGVSKKVCAG